jgi:uncharacterized protein
MEFEWDESKAASNEAKHGVSFREAASVFGDPLALTFDDPDHSEGEARLLTFGVSRFGHLLVVSHVWRDRRMRLISARRTTPGERRMYVEGT